MKVQAIKYAMLRKTDEFENDRCEVTIELETGDLVGDAVREAKVICEAALQAEEPETIQRTKTFEDLYQVRARRGLEWTSPQPVEKARNGKPARSRRRSSRRVS